MRMKRKSIFSMLLMVTMLLSGCAKEQKVSISEEELRSYGEQFIESRINGFRVDDGSTIGIWTEDSILDEFNPIYDIDSNITGYIAEIKNGGKDNGYMIFNIHNNGKYEISEYGYDSTYFLKNEEICGEYTEYKIVKEGGYYFVDDEGNYYSAHKIAEDGQAEKLTIEDIKRD